MAYRDRHRLDKPEPSVASNATMEGFQSEPTAKRPERATKLFHELESAIARIADLESKGRALRQRASSLELQLEATQRRLSTVEMVIRLYLVSMVKLLLFVVVSEVTTSA